MSEKKELFFIESLGPLYEAVQVSGVFEDSKFFVDAIPLLPVTELLKLYQLQKNEPGFDLKAFVSAHFKLPVETSSAYSSAQKSLDKHLQDLWEELQRQPSKQEGSLIPLPYRYIVPGGRFREIYYWDTYFTMLGLQVSGKKELIESMVNNFAYLIDTFGFIPNGNRTYYLSRSQPPFFAMMVQLLSEVKSADILLKYHQQLEKEYAFWMNGEEALSAGKTSVKHLVKMPDGKVLNRYWDEQATPRPEAFAEDLHLAGTVSHKITDKEILYRDIRAAASSGWDFSSRWFADKQEMKTIQTTSVVPVDLNCLLIFLEKMLLNNYTALNDLNAATHLTKKIQERQDAIQQYCWNETTGCYFDYNIVTQQQEIHFNLATAFPLFFEIASSKQADSVAALIKEKFLFPGGLVTTLYATGQQWDAPNGWAPLQWITYKGLKNYGFDELAGTIKKNWLSNCEKVYAATGKMMEKYNVMDTSAAAGGGEYQNQDGFGWTNGVYLKMSAETD